MYMAGRLRTASMPPRTLMESAVYSPLALALPLPFFAALRLRFSLSASIDFLFSVTAAAVDWESFGGICSIPSATQIGLWLPFLRKDRSGRATLTDNSYLPEISMAYQPPIPIYSSTGRGNLTTALRGYKA